VGLVHRHQGDPLPPHQLHEAGAVQPLGGDVQELVSVPPHPLPDLPGLLLIQPAVPALCRHPRLPQGGHLVLHQGDERRDDQRQPRQQHGRDLIAQGLSPAGGHDPQAVPPRQNGVDQDLLSRPESAVSKIPPANLDLIHFSAPFLPV